MYISQALAYALHGLTSLCQKPEGELIYAADIARGIGASESYLAKVMQLLVRAGLVTSTRGLNGGYALARRANQISVREVMEAVEDSIAHGSCILQNQSEVGRNCSACPVLTVLAAGYRRTLEELDAITIEDLARAVVPAEMSTLRKRIAGATGPRDTQCPVGNPTVSAAERAHEAVAS
jgi:Rrf2 family protein